MGRLDNKVAIVTGGSSGIGLATAHEFAACGANVTIFSRNEDKLKKVVLSLQNPDKQKHQYLVGDFNKPDTVQKIMRSHISSGNEYHILVNNSGGPHGGPLIEANEDEFRVAFERLLICNHILAKAVVPGMKEIKW